MILLDTDILIDFIRGHSGCRGWIISLGSQRIGISVVTSMELFAGCRNRADQQELRKGLAPYALLWPNASQAVAMIPTFSDAHLTHSTGILDSLIAATALSHKLKLYTFNQKHFAPFAGLQTMRPYAR